MYTERDRAHVATYIYSECPKYELVRYSYIWVAFGFLQCISPECLKSEHTSLDCFGYKNLLCIYSLSLFSLFAFGLKWQISVWNPNSLPFRFQHNSDYGHPLYLLKKIVWTSMIINLILFFFSSCSTSALFAILGQKRSVLNLIASKVHLNDN